MKIGTPSTLTQTTNSFGDVYFKEISGNIFSAIDACTKYDSTYGKNLLQADSFYIFCGTDSALLLHYVVQQDLPDNLRIIFVEEQTILHSIQNNLNLPDLPPNIAIVSSEDLPKQLDFFNIQSFALQDRMFFIPSLSVQYSDFKGYTHFADTVHDYVKTVHWNIRIDLDRKDFIIGQLENIAENITPASSLYGKFKEQTAVLLAGGPSLEEILPWVKSNRDKITVVAVSRTAKKLQKAAITPDFFVTVHTQDISFEVSKDMLSFHKETTLISHAQACPRLIGQWQGKHVFMGHVLPWDSVLNVPSKDLVGPTVSHAAYYVMVKMGFSTIIFGGVDLCFSQNLQSHSAGSIESELSSKSEGGDIQVPTNDGRMAETSFAFHRGIIEFSRMAQVSAKTGCKTINPFTTSARIDNVRLIPLQEISLSYLPPSSAQPIETLTISNESRLAHYENLKQELNIIQNQLPKMRKLGLQGFQLATAEIDDSTDLISECEFLIEQIREKEYAISYELIYSYGINFFNVLVKPLDQENQTATAEYYKLFFTAIIVSIDRINSLIDSSIRRLQHRKSECDGHPDLEKLTLNWIDDKQYGRVYLYEKRSDIDLNDLPEEKKKLITDMKDRYTEQFSSEVATSDIETSFEWTEYRLSKLREKLFKLFSQKDSNGLKDVVKSLDDNSTPIDSDYSDLAHGLYDELAGNTQDAFLRYNIIIERGNQNNSNILQDSLSRIASLSLSNNDMENAGLALQCLADLSDTYIPKYAEFLYLTEKIDEALEIYAQYLGKYPDDLQTMLKLGTIYKDLNSPDGVKMVVDHVLQKDPNNQTALSLQQYVNSND